MYILINEKIVKQLSLDYSKTYLFYQNIIIIIMPILKSSNSSITKLNKYKHIIKQSYYQITEACINKHIQLHISDGDDVWSWRQWFNK